MMFSSGEKIFHFDSLSISQLCNIFIVVNPLSDVKITSQQPGFH